MQKITRTATLIILLSLFFVSFSSASTIQGDQWYNGSPGVNTMQIWVLNSEVSIKNVKFDGKTIDGWSWSYAGDSKSSIILTGPATSNKGDVKSFIQFTAPDINTKFTVEWAEVGNGSIVTGIKSYSNKNWDDTNCEISHTPTPIPGSLFLLAGGLLFLAFARRRFSRS